ncbi:MAG: redoxin domain-containing protein [Planctomycetaceae bacterium]|nr:redoxin domain-containing protein [Planctomycetaceae bacterium]
MRLSIAVVLALLIGGAPWASVARSAPPEDQKGAANADPPAADSANDDSAAKNPFPGLGPAPSLDGGTEWLNTAQEINLRDLRGKIVLVDFWTYCCINCIHVLPDLKFLEQKYPNELVVIGVHAYKFENEKEAENIRQAILRYEIEHPVVNDSEKIIARKYFMQSWPTLVVLDPEGQYVGRVSGEGNRDLLDKVISEMIAFHRKKGTLNEEPLRFELERTKVEPGPLKFPGKVLADEAGGRLFVADSNHNRIVVASLDGTLLTTIGTGKIGRTDGAFDVAEFDHPQGMVLSGDLLYVADTENHLLRVVDLKNRTVGTLAGTGEQARSRSTGGALRDTPLNSPWALTIHDGVLYIAMAGPHQLWSHRLGTNEIGLFAGNGRENIVDGPRLSAELAQPSGITHDGAALYWVDSEGSAVRRMPFAGENIVTTIAGPHDVPHALFEFGDIDGSGQKVRLQHPLGLVHHDGMLYVADTYNHKIKRIHPGTGETTNWLGTGESGNGLDPVQLSEPAGLSAAGMSLFIADTNNHRILMADIETGEVSEFVIDNLAPPEK